MFYRIDLEQIEYFIEYYMMPGWSTQKERWGLYHYASKLENGKIVELGTFGGRSALVLAAPGTSRIWTIDSNTLVDHEHYRQSGTSRIEIAISSWMKVGVMNRIIPITAYVEHAVDLVPDEIDLLFIDAGHTYQEVLDNLRAYCPKLKLDGKLLLHDFSIEEEQWGVREAFGDFCREANEFSWIIEDTFDTLACISKTKAADKYKVIASKRTP